MLPPALQKALGGVESEAEAALLNRVDLAGLPTPDTQVRLIPGRRFRYDFVWDESWLKLVVELQGAVYKAKGAKRCPMCGEVPSGRHTRGTGYEADSRKAALAVAQGYAVIYVTPGMVASGEAITLIRAALIARGWKT